MSEILKISPTESDAFIDLSPDGPDDDRLDTNVDSRLRRLCAKNKRDAYHQRFGDDYHPEQNHLLPDDICQQELERAKEILARDYEEVEAEFVNSDSHENPREGIEIGVDGRRFSIPRDSVWKSYGSYVFLEVNSAVVTVLDEEKWPDIESIPHIKPETVTAIRDIAASSLIDDIRDLAIYLKLGDETYKQRISKKKTISVKATFDKFGVESVSELKKILRLIDLRIINTQDRLSADESQFDINSSTEVDALLEAIHRNKKDKKIKRRWLRGNL